MVCKLDKKEEKIILCIGNVWSLTNKKPSNAIKIFLPTKFAIHATSRTVNNCKYDPL